MPIRAAIFPALKSGMRTVEKDWEFCGVPDDRALDASDQDPPRALAVAVVPSKLRSAGARSATIAAETT